MHDSLRNGTLALGLVSAICATAVLIATWQVSAIYHQRAAESAHRADSYASYSDAEIEDICGRMAFGDAIECIREKVQAAQESQRAQDDLKAQQEMAQWAFWMMVASVSAVVVTAIGVVYVAATLGQTRKATKAAIDAVEVTREAYLNERRPWLFIEAAVNGPVTIKDGTINFQILYCISNVGSTPAVHVFQEFKSAVDHKREHEFRIYVNKLKEISISSGKSIFPNKKYEFIQKVSILAAEISKFFSDYRGYYNSVHPMASLVVAYQSPFGGGIMTTTYVCRLYRKWGKGFGTDDGSFGEDDVHLMDWGNFVPD